MDYSPVAKALRLIAVIWMVLSVVGGLIFMLLASGTDGSSFAVAMSLAAMLQGFLVGFSALILSELAPPRRT